MKVSKGLIVTLIVIIVLLVIALGVWIGISFVAGNSSPSALSPYSAVYLSTGDIYFGKLSMEPTPHMSDAWFLQRGTDSKGNPTVGVYPFNQVAWGPAGDVNFNPQQVIFWTRLSATSSIAQLIENPAQAQAAAAQNAAAGAGTSPTDQGSSSTGSPSVSTSTSTPSH